MFCPAPSTGENPSQKKSLPKIYRSGTADAEPASGNASRCTEAERRRGSMDKAAGDRDERKAGEERRRDGPPTKATLPEAERALAARVDCLRALRNMIAEVCEILSVEERVNCNGRLQLSGGEMGRGWTGLLAGMLISSGEELERREQARPDGDGAAGGERAGRRAERAPPSNPPAPAAPAGAAAAGSASPAQHRRPAVGMRVPRAREIKPEAGPTRFSRKNPSLCAGESMHSVAVLLSPQPPTLRTLLSTIPVMQATIA